jgi:pimeloyl-ACP methyl ester carboxylesterase
MTSGAPVRSGTLRVGDVALEYARIGQGRPLLVLSPSWWPLGPWRLRVAEELGRDFELVLFNHRGVGGSDAPDEGYTVARFAADAAGLARGLGFERVHALGFALGAATALVLARDFPDLVASVAAVAAGGPTRPERAEALLERVRAAIAAEGYAHYMRSHASSGHAFSPTFAAARPDVVRGLGEALWDGHASEDVFLRHAAARASYDFGDWLEALRTPVLVAVGAEDHAARGESTPVAMAHELARRLPNARLALIPEAGHMMLWEGTEAFGAALRAFVADVERGAV